VEEKGGGNGKERKKRGKKEPTSLFI